MTQGAVYPFAMVFSKKAPKGRDDFRVSWSWPGHPKSTLTSSNLRFSSKLIEQFKSKYPVLVEPSGHAPEVRPSSGKNVIVYHDSERFAGWPANGGVWHWDNEILVAFTLGYYKDLTHLGKHSRDSDKPASRVFARSRDGGETWTLEQPLVSGDRVEPGSIQFTHPDFALLCNDDRFRVSYDRGKT